MENEGTPKSGKMQLEIDKDKTRMRLAIGLIVSLALIIIITIVIVIWKYKNPNQQGGPDETGATRRGLTSFPLKVYLDNYENSKKDLDKVLSGLKERSFKSWNHLKNYDDEGFKLNFVILRGPSDPVYKRTAPIVLEAVSKLFSFSINKGLYLRARYISENNLTNSYEIFGATPHKDQIDSYFSDLHSIMRDYELIARRFLTHSLVTSGQDLDIYDVFTNDVEKFCNFEQGTRKLDESALNNFTEFLTNGVDNEGRMNALNLYINELHFIISSLEGKNEIPCALPLYRYKCYLDVYSRVLRKYK